MVEWAMMGRTDELGKQEILYSSLLEGTFPKVKNYKMFEEICMTVLRKYFLEWFQALLQENNA